MATLQQLIDQEKPIGKLGNYVYYWWRGQYKRRVYFLPVQPATPPQKIIWTKFKINVKRWQKSTQTVKDEYNLRAKDLPLSGFNLFMREKLLGPP